MSYTYTSKKFSYDSEKDLFVAYASDLFGFDGRVFYIRSSRTGKTRMFLVDQREFSDEAHTEFVAWHCFSPMNGHHATIFND